MDGSLHLPLTSARARRPTRRLVALKQHRGNHALGLILLGFVLGVAAAIAVMMRMEPRSSPPAASAPERVATPAYAPIQLQVLHAAPSPVAAVAGSPPAILALPGGPPARAAKAPLKPAPLAAPSALTAEDAAATGMTARRSRSTGVEIDQLF